MRSIALCSARSGHAMLPLDDVFDYLSFQAALLGWPSIGVDEVKYQVPEIGASRRARSARGCGRFALARAEAGLVVSFHGLLVLNLSSHAITVELN
jgi:hypothetical protein